MSVEPNKRNELNRGNLISVMGKLISVMGEPNERNDAPNKRNDLLAGNPISVMRNPINVMRKVLHKMGLQTLGCHNFPTFRFPNVELPVFGLLQTGFPQYPG
jgi:hypothetical protein